MCGYRNSLFGLVLTMVMQSSCIQINRTNKDDVDYSDIFFKQYAFLLRRSLEYNIEDVEFKYEIQAFLNNYKEKAPGLDTLINPFSNNASRNGPVILYPYLFNTKKDRVVLLILSRETNMSGAPVEKVKFALGNRVDDEWIFTKKKAHVRSFSYEGGHPVLSDTEIALRILRTFIDWNYMPLGEVKINDDFFEEGW